MLSITRQSVGLAQTQSAVLSRGFVVSAVSSKKKESLLPAAPKGAPTSYGLFVKDRYTSDRSSYITPETSGKAGITAASSKIAQEWNDLSSTLKDEYAAKAKELKRTYDAEYRKWYDSLDKETIKAYEKASGKKVAQPGGRAANKKALDAKAKESGQPPRPLTAFFEYLETFRSGEGKGLGVVELAKKAGEEWKAMVEEEKQKFRDTAADKKAKYLEWQNSQTKQ